MSIILPHPSPAGGWGLRMWCEKEIDLSLPYLVPVPSSFLHSVSLLGSGTVRTREVKEKEARKGINSRLPFIYSSARHHSSSRSWLPTWERSAWTLGLSLPQLFTLQRVSWERVSVLLPSLLIPFHLRLGYERARWRVNGHSFPISRLPLS